MSHEVVITTGSRLHFGLLAHKPDSGREFGGAGLMLESPGFRIRVRKSESDLVEGPPTEIDRVQRLIGVIRENSCDTLPKAVSIQIEAAIDAHFGLGSGTQIALALATALRRLEIDEPIEAHRLAQWTERGVRSAIGIHGFEKGGFLIEGGKPSSAQIAPLVLRIDFPDEWRFLLVTPNEVTGLHGAPEKQSFARLPPMPAATTDELCRRLLMELVPALIERDFSASSDALYEFGQTAGSYFKQVQGGVFADRQMERLAKRLQSEGLRGVGQTSWGPTLFALCPDQKTALQWERDLYSDPLATGCRIRIAAPMNSGADIAIS